MSSVRASRWLQSRLTPSPLRSHRLPSKRLLKRLPLKPFSRYLGLAAAFVAATGLSPVAAAQPTLAPNERGDLALVPYYTVLGEWVTGLHIVNTSARTQVVKVRFRRATDGMDALDFNLVLSPHDVYAGFLSRDASGAIAWSSPDTSCTVPATRGKRLQMPDLYRAGAESGYVEIIAMGAPEDEGQPIALAAKHARPASAADAAGSSTSSTSATTAARPLDCAAVRSNFFADGAGTATGTMTRPGVENTATTWQAASMAAAIKAGGRNRYVDSGDVLKVSYFIRDNATGMEFGDNAVHLGGFLAQPVLTNQQYGVLSGDLNGFDFPDLNGGVPRSSAGGASIQRAGFDALRGALGATAVLNEWSANPANGVELDWVLTLPGQYTMLRLPQYVASLSGAGRPWAPTLGAAGKPLANPRCPRVSTPATTRARDAAGNPAGACDYRDLPVALHVTAYNREEFQGEAAAGELVVSPAPPSTTATTYLPKVANVITFGERSALGRGGVLGLSDAHIDADLGQPYGWVSARVTSLDRDVQVCDWDFANDASSGFGASAGAALNNALRCAPVTHIDIPVIGFAAWSRRVAANPAAPYGRIVEHSYPTLACAARSGAPRVTISGRVHNGPVAGATVILRDLAGHRLARAVTDQNGRYSLKAPSSCIAGGYYLQAFGGTINGAAFSGVMSAIYAASDNPAQANITPITTLIARMAESYAGSTRVEQRDRAIQKAVALGLLRAADVNRIDAAYVEESIVRSMIAERGLDRWIGDVLADLQDGALSRDLMGAFPNANGGIIAFKLRPESTVALFPGETKRVGAEFETSDGEYLLTENGDYLVIGADGAEISAQASPPPAISIDNKPNWISVDRGVLRIAPSDSVARQAYTFTLHARKSDVSTGRTTTLTVNVLDGVTLLSGEIGPAGGEIMNFWKDIILSVEPDQLSQNYRFTYYAAIDDTSGDIYFRFSTTPEMPIAERLKVQITQPDVAIIQHNYIEQAPSGQPSARPSLTAQNKPTASRAASKVSASAGVSRAESCDLNWVDYNRDGHRFDHMWIGNEALFHDLVDGVDNGGDPRFKPETVTLGKTKIRFTANKKAYTMNAAKRCSSALRSAVSLNDSSLTDEN